MVPEGKFVIPMARDIRVHNFLSLTKPSNWKRHCDTPVAVIAYYNVLRDEGYCIPYGR